jgi:hypothetical protein
MSMKLRINGVGTQGPAGVLVAHRRWGKRSGSSLENIAACTPLFQVRRRFDGLYTGRFEFGQIASSPLSPSTMASA